MTEKERARSFGPGSSLSSWGDKKGTKKLGLFDGILHGFSHALHILTSAVPCIVAC